MKAQSQVESVIILTRFQDFRFPKFKSELTFFLPFRHNRLKDCNFKEANIVKEVWLTLEADIGLESK